MAKELRTEQKMDEVRARFLSRFAEVFGYSDVLEGSNDFSFVKLAGYEPPATV
jgi:hypothetical protein